MATPDIITQGLGLTPGSVRWMVTSGFGEFQAPPSSIRAGDSDLHVLSMGGDSDLHVLSMGGDSDLN